MNGTTLRYKISTDGVIEDEIYTKNFAKISDMFFWVNQQNQHPFMSIEIVDYIDNTE